MSARALPIPRAQNVVEAMAYDTPVVVYCMSCGRSKKVDPYLIAAKFGPVPFGMLAGTFPCKQCNERLAVVLPWYTPNPREWVKIAKTYQDAAAEPMVQVDGRAFAYRVDIWKNNHSDIERNLAHLDELHMARAAYDAALKQYPKDDITMRHGMNVIRDSRRPDVKPVK